MDELVANPDGCSRFEPNQFKKEKCKQCGRQWQEHLGVISQALVDELAGAKRKLTEEKLQKEAEAKAKLKAKAVAKKKANQAVEDQWLHDGAEDDHAHVVSDDDDDLGFRMFNAGEFQQRQVQPTDAKPMKMKNLIDFSECDVADDPLPLEVAPPVVPPARQLPVSPSMGPMGAANPISALPTLSMSVANPISAGPTMSMPGGGLGGAGNSLSGAVDEFGSMTDLLGEIEHLRHMLRNADEERSIQVDIVRDEVAEKQKIIEDMKRQRTEDQADLNTLRQQVASASSQTEELARLRVEVEELRRSKDAFEALPPLSPSPPPPSPSPDSLNPPSVANCIAEVHSLCIRSCQALSVCLEPEQQQGLSAAMVTDAPEDALRRLLEVATKAETAAQCRCDLVASDASKAEELARLTGEVEELRRAKDALPSPKPPPPPPPPASPNSLPPALADRIVEVHSLCIRTCQSLSVCSEAEQQEVLSAVMVRDAPEAALRRLGEVATKAEAAAQQSNTERKSLASQLADAQVAANAAISAAAAAAASAPVAPAVAPPPKPEEASPQVASEAINRQAAMALREVRLNAEQQLAWITRRIKMGRPGNAS